MDSVLIEVGNGIEISRSADRYRNERATSVTKNP
jgi:hypothetical protein